MCEVSSKYLKQFPTYRADTSTWLHGRNGYFKFLQCLKGCYSKGRLTRVMAFMFCTSSHGAVHLQEIS